MWPSAAALPDLDGIQLSILGLTNSVDGSILHTYASGPMRSAYQGSPERNLAPAIWIPSLTVAARALG